MDRLKHSNLHNVLTADLLVEVPGIDDGPVGHGEGVAGTLGHLHSAGGHPDAGGVCNLQCRLHVIKHPLAGILTDD